MAALTAKQESFCENTGIFGILISLTSLIQFIVLSKPHWVTYISYSIFLLTILGFILLMMRLPAAFSILLISSILLFLLEAFMLLGNRFSLILLISMLYTFTITIFMSIEGVNKALKDKVRSEKAEQEKWRQLL